MSVCVCVRVWVGVSLPFLPFFLFPCPFPCFWFCVCVLSFSLVPLVFLWRWWFGCAGISARPWPLELPASTCWLFVWWGLVVRVSVGSLRLFCQLLPAASFCSLAALVRFVSWACLCLSGFCWRCLSCLPCVVCALFYLISSLDLLSDPVLLGLSGSYLPSHG